MTVASIMRQFTVGTFEKVWRVQVIFKFLCVVAVWPSDIQIHGELISGDFDVRRVGGASGLTQGYASPQFAIGTSYQPQQTSPEWLSYDKRSEYIGNAFYQPSRIKSYQLAAFPLGYQTSRLQEIYRQKSNSPNFQTLQPQLQQLGPFPPPQPNPLDWQRTPQRTPSQQVQSPWPQHPLYLPPFGPAYQSQYPSWVTQHQIQNDFHPQHQDDPPSKSYRPNDNRNSENFKRDYGSRAAALSNVEKLLTQLTELINAVRPLRQSLPKGMRLHLFKQAAHLLGRVASVGVALMSHRNNSDLDKQLDGLLHKMEDRSYQLKTMLIELQSLGSENIPVATPPKILQFSPLEWNPRHSWIRPIGRDLGTPQPSSWLGTLDS